MSLLPDLDPATYVPHELHGTDRVYSETNCFNDVMIEVVHALGMEPRAMLASAVAVDFELDQWTFFKPSVEDMFVLYGLDVHEMLSADLVQQSAQRLEVGQLIMPEVDGWWLPDTAGTSYRAAHVKTSIVIESIDDRAQTMRYFHNTGFHRLEGADYRGVFGLEPVRSAEVLPGYVELLRPDAGPRPAGAELRVRAHELLADHLRRRPRDNPFVRFAARLAADLPGLLEGDLATYHAYAFANARMMGSAFEMLAAHLRWLDGDAGEPVATLLDGVAGASKVLLFRLARRRLFDVDAIVCPMAADWQRSMDGLDRLVAGSR